MNTKHTRRAAAAIAVVLGCLGFLAGPASAATHTGTVSPGSKITLVGNYSGTHEFELGEAPDEAPPAECGLPGPDDWEPSTIEFDITPGNPDNVTTTFDFDPGYADLGMFGDYRAQISGTGTGTITSAGAVSIAIDGSVDFEECAPGFPHACTAQFSGTLTGTFNSYPITTGSSTATVSGTINLSANSTDCPNPLFEFDLNGASATVVLVIDF